MFNPTIHFYRVRIANLLNLRAFYFHSVGYVMERFIILYVLQI